MSYEQKENKGALFKNKYKKQDSHPDYQGDAKIICPHCNNVAKVKIAGWLNKTKDGDKFLGLSFKTDTEPEQRPAVRNPPQEPGVDEDDLPF